MPNAAQNTSKPSSAKPAGKKSAAAGSVAAKKRGAKQLAVKKATKVQRAKKSGVVGAGHVVSGKAKSRSVSDVVKELALSYGFEHSRPRKKAAAPNPYDMSAEEAKKVLRGAGVVTKSGKLSSVYK